MAGLVTAAMVLPHDPKTQLRAHAKRFYKRGWMAGTGGNMSVRASASSFWITASGVFKGALQDEQLLEVDLSGHPVRATAYQPSAETSIHQAIYVASPQAQAVYHVHPANWTAASLGQHLITLPATLEVLKLFPEFDHQDIDVPVLENHRRVSDIAKELATLLRQPRFPAMMIQGHGLTTWAMTPEQAFNQVEVLVFALDVLSYRK